jgi:hypothetical protein
MSEASPVEGRERPLGDEPSATPQAQAKPGAKHAPAGWNAYEVWRSRVFVPPEPGYNKPRGNR